MYIYNISKNNIFFYNNLQKNLPSQKQNLLIIKKIENIHVFKNELNNIFFIFLNFLKFIKTKIFYIFLNSLKFKKSFNFFKLKNNKIFFKKYNICFFLQKKKR
jgi:hypothetical protein